MEANASILAVAAACSALVLATAARSDRHLPELVDGNCTMSFEDLGGWGQAEPAPQEESELDRMLRLAREASPVVRPQAARRFVGMGAEAAARVRAVTGGTPAGYAALGLDLIEVLGELDSAEVRTDLWKALDDRDFPWRPSAARSLAKTARDGESARFRAALEDPIATVRAAGVVGLATLDDRQAAIAVRARLNDPDDRVRREAAVLSDRWGDATALWWLVEDLKRTDRFFDLDTGKLARFEATRLLTARLGEDLGFAPERAPTDADNQQALKRIAERVSDLSGATPPDLPRVALAGGAAVRGVLGLEVRSCRRGEHFLRWDADGFLWIGTGNAEPFALPAGATEALVRRATELAEALGEEDFWGEPGCDVEVFYLPRPEEDGGGVRALRVSKGPAAVEGLRPEPLSELAQALLASLPDEAGELRGALSEALAAVGGALPE